MVLSLSDAQKAPRGTLEAVLLSEPISSFETSEVEHGVCLPHKVHALVGGDARVHCRTTGQDDGMERQYGAFFFFPCRLGCFWTLARRRLRYALTARVALETCVADGLMEESARRTTVKPGRTESKRRVSVVGGAAVAVGSVAEGCSGPNRIGGVNVIDHVGSTSRSSSVDHSGGRRSVSELKDGKAGV